MKHLSLILIIILTQFINAQNSKTMDYKIDGMTIAVTNMEAMIKFYKEVFNIEFKEQDLFETKLYSGNWGGMDLLFCPASVAGNKAKQNRHQFDVIVHDLRKLIGVVKKYGGKMIGEISEDEKSLSVGIFDPDNNSILFKQIKGE